jgi:hypothetical protein
MNTESKFSLPYKDILINYKLKYFLQWEDNNQIFRMNLIKLTKRFKLFLNMYKNKQEL